MKNRLIQLGMSSLLEDFIIKGKRRECIVGISAVSATTGRGEQRHRVRRRRILLSLRYWNKVCSMPKVRRFQ
jgi:hypothetical protein